jgi:phage portal protein BeeE
LNLLQRLRTPARDITSIDDYIAAVGMLARPVYEQTLTQGRESVGGGFGAFSTSAYAADSVVFACMDVRAKVFSSVRFRWQRLRGGKPSDMYGSTELRVLERPWVGGTTQDMLTRMIQDADLAGNSFWTRIGGEAVRLRPDWVEIAVGERMYGGGKVGLEKLGYVYYEGGRWSGNDGVALLASEVAHFMPIPDPLASFRGMSWLTPIVREIEADLTMTRHKRKFFENGATPNMVVKHAEHADQQAILDFARKMEMQQAGTDNAYKTFHLYPGADATVVGVDLQSVDFRAVQGAGETRIAAAASVPPVIVGLSEGLAAATYSNYGQARRRFADGTMHPLWANAAGSLEPLLPAQGPDVRLWYDATDVPFLREDEKDAAVIAQTQASTMTALIQAGYTPDSVAAAVEASDWRLLEHTGLFSVQLQPPGAQQEAQEAQSDEDAAA